MNDEAFCRSILPRVSRTFALSIEALPEPLRSTLRSAYLLCRVVDTIEDDAELPRDLREWLFDEFSTIVADDSTSTDRFEAAFADFEPNDDRELCRNLGAPIRVFRSVERPLAEAARPHILEMAFGMASYARRWRGPDDLTVLEDQADLEKYCYYVAGTVGNLLTEVFLTIHEELDGELGDGLRERAVSFGQGLQMTNIVKDVATDHLRGWCFLPASVCARHGVAPTSFLDPEVRSQAMSVIGDVVALARGHLADALEYTLLLPHTAPEVRLFVLVPLALALASLSLVETNPAVLVPGETVKVSRKFVADVLGEARAVVVDDEGLRSLCSRASALKL